MDRRKLIAIPAAALLVAGCQQHQMVVQDVRAPTEVLSRENGASVTVHDLGNGVRVHTYTAPESSFLVSSHIIESDHQLVLIDAQMLFPTALDLRHYALSHLKPISRILITHAHPDHYLGLTALSDVNAFALPHAFDEITRNGDSVRENLRATMGDLIADTFVAPTNTMDQGELELDGVRFIFQEVKGTEADSMLVTKLPDHGAIFVGDIASNGVHLFLAGDPKSWIKAIEDLQASSEKYPMVLGGHGAPGGSEVYAASKAWLEKAAEVRASAATGADFRTAMVEAFPGFAAPTLIDVSLPYLYPEDAAEPPSQGE